jgi:hypothetical protein
MLYEIRIKDNGSFVFFNVLIVSHDQKKEQRLSLVILSFEYEVIGRGRQLYKGTHRLVDIPMR